MYKNFNALSTESLDFIFNRLQKIVSQLAILGENISQKDLNLKFLRSLPSEWNTHVVVWRIKPDLDIKSFDDLYNNFMIVEQELELQEKGVIDSGCFRHMTGNMSYLSKYKEIDGGYVAFREDPKGGKITTKGKINIGNQSNDSAGEEEKKDAKDPGNEDNEEPIVSQEKDLNFNSTGNGYNKKGQKSKQNQTKPSTKQKARKSQQSKVNKKSNLTKSKPKESKKSKKPKKRD
nr:hypothetical protein [Tanacetum cinerariifolium]